MYRVGDEIRPQLLYLGISSPLYMSPTKTVSSGATPLPLPSTPFQLAISTWPRLYWEGRGGFHEEIVSAHRGRLCAGAAGFS